MRHRHLADTRVWSGEFDKVNALREGDDLHFGELALKLAAYVQKKHVRWVWSPAFGNSNPWWPAYEVIGRAAPKEPTASTVFGGDLNIGVGRAYRADKPEWQMKPVCFGASMCFAHEPAYQWLTKTTLQAMEAGRYGAFGWGDDFFGQPGFGGGPGYNGGRGPKGEPAEPWVHPARCENPLHEHVDPDTNYLCMRNLTAHVRLMRQRFPDLYINHARPAMDLGVWAMRYVDSSFTVNEWAALEGIKGMGPQPVNVLLGDKIRHWSRVRVHHQFFPHYIDSPQLFAAPKSMPSYGVVDWQREKLDYILLSALSCAPSQTFYLPTQAGIPVEDKREIKKWLDWGRANIDYLFVRKDLPHWPTPGKVDGSAHIIDDRGVIFLFNPNASALPGEFALTKESTGLTGEGEFRIAQEHPAPDRTVTARAGETIRWEVPAQTAYVLRIQKLPPGK